MQIVYSDNLHSCISLLSAIAVEQSGHKLVWRLEYIAGTLSSILTIYHIFKAVKYKYPQQHVQRKRGISVEYHNEVLHTLEWAAQVVRDYGRDGDHLDYGLLRSEVGSEGPALRLYLDFRIIWPHSI